MQSVILSELAKRLWKVFRVLVLLGLGFVILYPILFMTSSALRPLSQANDPSIVWLPKSLTFENFALAFRAMKYPRSLLNTLVVSGGSALLQVASSAMIGYGLARFRFRGRGVLFAIVLFSILVPPQTISVPLFALYRNFTIPYLGPWLESITGWTLHVNLINSPLSFYIPAALGMGIRSGVYIFVFRQFFGGMPKELEDAALVDGCKPFGIFVRIMSPVASGAYLTVFLFSFVWYWNDYFMASMLLDNRRTLAISLSMLRSGLQSVGLADVWDPYLISARMQAGALLTILPILVLFIILQRYFTEGIERTGIVG